MKYFKKIVGKRIYLSPMNAEDAALYVKWLNDFGVTDNIGASSRVTTLDDEKEWIQKNSNKFIFAIVKAEDDSLIGNCGFHNIDQGKQCAEVGIFIGEKKFWNQGYGCEAMRLMLRHGFNDLNLNRIYLRVYATNPRAVKSYEKAGFTHEGQLRQAHFQGGQYVDVLLMSILRSEWNE